MSADMDALVEKAARAMVPPTVDPDRPHGTGKFEAPMWTFYVDDARLALEAVGLPALLERVEAAEGEVAHWKAHAEEAGAGFAEVCKTSARVTARNYVLARERDDIFADLNALTNERDALVAKVADVRTVLAEIDGYGWNTGRAVRLRAALTGAVA